MSQLLLRLTKVTAAKGLEIVERLDAPSKTFVPWVEIVMGFVWDRPVTSFIVMTLPWRSEAGGRRIVRGVVVIILANVAVLGT